MKICLSFTLLFLSASCGFIHYMGTKTQVDKTESEIARYLHQNKVDFYDYNLLLKDELSDSLNGKKHALNLWQVEHGSKQATVQLRIYDSIGRLVNAYTGCYGDFKKMNILAEKPFKVFSYLPTNYNLRFPDNLELWKVTESEEREILAKAGEKKYTLVFYWNVWSNYYSKIIFRKLKKYLKEFRMKEDLLIILVNTDRAVAE